ncbi:glycoside hydrolase family 25 protein [Flammeovirga agarivorans]|uniref:Glycoside hydrolase family 25 protein n=1 Tax=Flammeovirga agarivorans TaxID=2726742 RepID=A0A7X8SPF9_9BACT|nr:GH25 family lysozyme [Flammeovirga agarivorans]NLR93974.1 glycoside hydrolase family 25 protein [Flammeovirga agarivorans]
MSKKVNIFPFSSFLLIFFMGLGYLIKENPDVKASLGPYIEKSINLVLNVRDYIEVPFYKHIDGYGVKLPNKYSVHGIDVSHHQKLIDWKRVSEMYAQDTQVKFVYAKATEGEDHKDRHFYHNRKNAKKELISFGAYHFFRPKKSGTKQAEFFIETIGELHASEMVPVVDIEILDGIPPEIMRERLADFLQKVEDEWNIKPMIYTGDSFYKDYLKGHFRKYRVWIANYGQETQASTKRWTMWQHTQSATIDGIPESVDMNVFYGDWEAFKKAMLVGYQSH